MAKFEVWGMDGLEKFITGISALPAEVIDDMLNAEADIVVKAQSRTASEMLRGKHSKGVTSATVKKRKFLKSGDGRVVYISFSGTRKRGNSETANAEVAFINEYGKTGQPARPFIRTANEQCVDEAVAAAAEVYDRFVDSL